LNTPLQTYFTLSACPRASA